MTAATFRSHPASPIRSGIYLQKPPVSRRLLAGAALLTCAALTGCGAATKTPGTAANETLVNLDPPKPKVEGRATATADAAQATDEAARRQGILEALGKLESAGAMGILKSLDTDVDDLTMGGIVGGVAGGVGSGGLGGLGSVYGGSVGGTLGAGGLGLSGIGMGGGGRGEGIGLGTMASARVSPYSSNTISGQSVYSNSDSVLELGDSGTLGITLEDATRAIRNRAYGIRDCYSNGLVNDAALAGQVTLRLIIGKEGAVEYVGFIDSGLSNTSVLACIKKELLKTHVGSPQGGLFGVIETVLRFRPAQNP